MIFLTKTSPQQHCHLQFVPMVFLLSQAETQMQISAKSSSSQDKVHLLQQQVHGVLQTVLRHKMPWVDMLQSMHQVLLQIVDELLSALYRHQVHQRSFWSWYMDQHCKVRWTLIWQTGNAMQEVKSWWMDQPHHSWLTKSTVWSLTSKDHMMALFREWGVQYHKWSSSETINTVIGIDFLLRRALRSPSFLKYSNYEILSFYHIIDTSCFM